MTPQNEKIMAVTDNWYNMNGRKKKYRSHRKFFMITKNLQMKLAEL